MRSASSHAPVNLAARIDGLRQPLGRAILRSGDLAGLCSTGRSSRSAALS
jgi:hypothetical protein